VGKFWFLHPLIWLLSFGDAWILEQQNVISFGICKHPYATSGKILNRHWVLIESSTKALLASFSPCLPLTQSTFFSKKMDDSHAYFGSMLGIFLACNTY
jgi:hypothetical protein